ncbi:MAG: hypothetical protein ABJP70_11505 [Erythrobacter sp.]
MADFPWVFWIVSSAFLQAFLAGYILRRKSKGSIVDMGWSFRPKGEMPKEKDPELFDRVITGWWMLFWTAPILTFGLIYLKGY